MPPLGVLILLCAVFGLAVGSFLNVVIYRVPRHESIASPPSACPTCGTAIAARDNVPVISWLLLRGRCRHCHSPISPQYPLVELATAVLFAGLAVRFGYDWALPAYLALFAGLLALSWIDVERLLLPKAIVYPLLLMVASLLLLPAGVYGMWHTYWVAWAFAGGWFVVFFLMNFASPRVLGFGDGPRFGMARVALRDPGVLRCQLDRRGDRDRPDPDEAPGASGADPLRRLPGARYRNCRVLRTGAIATVPTILSVSVGQETPEQGLVVLS
jgi:prepilin signal peptidase PulO-like enzyme (type II secretory pathway)